MSAAAIALVLSAAILHASWNALLKGGGGRFRAMTIMSVVSATASVPPLLLWPLPASGCLPFIIVSAVIHVAYNLSLVRAYAYGDLGQVYPVARGSSPLLVTLGAAMTAGEQPAAPAFAGILLVSCGIFGLAEGWRKTVSKTGLLAALATGVLIASYTVADGLGARLSGSPASYAAWLFLIDGAPMVFIYGRWRREDEPLLRIDTATLRAALGGFVSIAAYAAVIYAATIAPMGEVSALRETSVVFAALLGRMFLSETLSAARLASCIAVAVGAICLGGWS